MNAAWSRFGHLLVLAVFIGLWGFLGRLLLDLC